MQRLSRMLGIVMLAVLIAQMIGTVPILAQSAATLSGTVLDESGTPVSGATVTITGPASVSAKTGAGGKYTLSAPEGLYRVLVRAGGYSDATEDGIALSPSGNSLDVRLSRPTLSTLQTIGSVRSSGGAGGPAFNATASSQATVSSQVFDNQGDVGVRDVLSEIPGIVISQSNGSSNGGVRGSITFPNIRGGLPYETASLIDGHPLSVGKFGDYVTTFINRYMYQSIEVQKGPGSMPNQITRSVNGTVNFRTWDPTPTLTGDAQIGIDSWGGKFSNLRISDTVLKGKLGFVFAYATEGTPGPGGSDDPRTFLPSITNVSYTDSSGVPVSPSASTAIRAPGALNTTGQASNTIGCCISLPTWFLNRSELAKLRFNFSAVTSFTATMLASQTYASQNGNNISLDNVAFNPSIPNPFLKNGNQQAAFLFQDNFAQDYEFNSEPIFSAELRTQLKNDNVLARFYSASIARLLTNGDHTNTNFNVPVNLYGTTSGGAPLNGVDAFGKPFIATINSPLFEQQEQDNLLGYTFEYDHALGNSGNIISLAVDQNYSWTHVYTPGAPAGDGSSTSNIPQGSATNTGTYSLKGSFQIGPKLNATAAYYLTRLDSHFPIFTGAAAPFNINFGDTITWHNDVRLGLAYRFNRDTSGRLAIGSALVPPFLGILAGSNTAPTLCTTTNCPAGFQPSQVAVNNAGGINVQPETSFGYDIGFDTRVKGWPDTVISADAYLTNLHNQFLKSVFLNGTANVAPAGVVPLYTTAFSNLADARYAGIELKIDHSPAAGIGYAVQGALIRGYPYNVPQSIYQFNNGVPTSNQGIVPYLNFGAIGLQGGTALPYSQGYAEVNYKTLSGWYANVGVIYFGPNNTFNEPAFPVTRATLRVPIHNKDTYLQASVDNVFNINPEIQDIFGAGFAQPAVGGGYEPTNLKGYGPRNLHLVLAHTFR